MHQSSFHEDVAACMDLKRRDLEESWLSEDLVGGVADAFLRLVVVGRHKVCM
jgi:hypothetical protein